MQKMINKVHVEGIVYSHDLKLKIAGPESKNPGQEYLRGTINIATDDEMTNIIPIYFIYLTRLTKSGSPNSTFKLLERLVGSNPEYRAWTEESTKPLLKIRVDGSLGLNEFYSEKGELVSTKRNVGSFVHEVIGDFGEKADKNSFQCDILIKGVTRIEADPERQLEERVEIQGYTFDYRNNLLPMTFVATHPNAMIYFEGLDASPSSPILTKIWGHNISNTITKSITEKSAFGEELVREVQSTRRMLLVTGAAQEPYLFGDEEVFTVDELKHCLENREIQLASNKKSREEYQKKRQETSTNVTATLNPQSTPASGVFNF